MLRSKPYERKQDRNTDDKWTHDRFGSAGGSLGSRIEPTRKASGGLLERLGGQGRELIPDSGPVRSSRNSGVELFPSSSKAARPARNSGPRGSPGEPGQRALVANSLKALSSRGSPRASSLSIMGAARGSTFVRVEQLVQGTTAEDVQASFSAYPISSSRLVSSPGSRTATVEVEVADRASADALVKQYDGVLADGERLRLTIVSRTQTPPRADPPRRMADRIGRGIGRERPVQRKELSPPLPPSG